MRTFKKSIVIFLLFMIGTCAAVHVDRQCGAMTGSGRTVIEKKVRELLPD